MNNQVLKLVQQQNKSNTSGIDEETLKKINQVQAGIGNGLGSTNLLTSNSATQNAAKTNLVNALNNQTGMATLANIQNTGTLGDTGWWPGKVETKTGNYGGSGGNNSGVVADYKANLNNLYNNVMNYGAYAAGTYTPGRYVSQYDTSEIEGQLKGWLNEIDNYEQFKYDLNADMLYKQYVDNAMMQGQTAMQDTMAQAAALTGGYGNSYAAAVGNQAYQNYITQANNNIPAFQQMAMNVWQSGLDQLMNQYNAGTQQLNNLLNLDAQALARWQANENLAFSAWQANEQNAYNEWLAGYNQVNDQYGTGKDYYGTLMELEKASGGSGSGSSGNKASTTTSTSNLPASVQNVLNNATQAQLVTAEDWVKLLDAANKKK